MRVGSFLCALLIVPLPFLACSKLVYTPTPVVPTTHSLPYSAKLTLAQVEAYTVRPGATMIADPILANHVTGVSDILDSARADWEQAILQYLEARKTFVRVTTGSPSDLDLVMHVNIYIDPGVHFQFKHVYVARVDAAVRDPRTRVALLTYTGHGKAAGEVSRDGQEDDQKPVNQAVQMALNDLFGKMEQDSRMLRLGTTN